MRGAELLGDWGYWELVRGITRRGISAEGKLDLGVRLVIRNERQKRVKDDFNILACNIGEIPGLVEKHSQLS